MKLFSLVLSAILIFLYSNTYGSTDSLDKRIKTNPAQPKIVTTCAESLGQNMSKARGTVLLVSPFVSGLDHLGSTDLIEIQFMDSTEKRLKIEEIIEPGPESIALVVWEAVVEKVWHESSGSLKEQNFSPGYSSYYNYANPIASYNAGAIFQVSENNIIFSDLDGISKSLSLNEVNANLIENNGPVSLALAPLNGKAIDDRWTGSIVAGYFVTAIRSTSEK